MRTIVALLLFLMSCGSNEITINWNIELEPVATCEGINVEKRKWTLSSTGPTFYLATPSNKTLTFMSGTFWEDIEGNNTFRNIVFIKLEDILKGYWTVDIIADKICTARYNIKGTS